MEENNKPSIEKIFIGVPQEAICEQGLLEGESRCDKVLDRESFSNYCIYGGEECPHYKRKEISKKSFEKFEDNQGHNSIGAR